MGDAERKAKKKQLRKKKRISKHVSNNLKEKSASSESVKQSPPTTEAATATGVSSAATRKDPIEAVAYLERWKTKAGWKFNKNTQFWLIRHMYESDKVPKGSFATLVEYLQQGLSTSVHNRVIEEATRRALRYREFEKNSEKESVGHSENTEANAETGEGDDARWGKLTDHDKRKEYKRARKLLEVLQSKNE